VVKLSPSQNLGDLIYIMTREQGGLRGLRERGFTALDHARESIGRRRTDEFRAPRSKGSGRVLLFFSSFCLMKIAAQRGGST
jgi:hypothetical protein